MMDISIVIVSWNGKEYLKKCLESIPFKNSQHSIEALVVDNASTDGAPEMVAQTFPQVHLIRNPENYGFAKANNIGIRRSTGRYICLVNSDVVILDDCIDRMIAYIKDHPEIGILGPQILYPDLRIQRSCMGSPSIWNAFCRTMALDTLMPRTRLFGGELMTYWPHDTLRSVDIINGCFWMVKREAMDQVGFLDERFFIYAEDKDWCKRFWDNGWQVVYFPEARAIHFKHGSSANAPVRFYIELQRANIQYWKKHHNRGSQITVMLLTVLHHVLRLPGLLLRFVLSRSKRSESSFKIKGSIASIQWISTAFFSKD